MKLRTIQREAPNINGFVVPISELDLGESYLDPNDPEAKNWHHMQHSRVTYEQFSLFALVRNLHERQEEVLRDIHTEYHRLYLPPPRITPEAAMNRLTDAYDAGELLHIREPGTGFILTPITKSLYRAAVRDYEEMR